MSWLDWAVLGTAALVAISGYVEGFVLGACATLGLLGGAAIGVWGVPKALDHFSPSVTVSFAALVLVVGLAALGRMLGALVGTKVRRQLSWRPIRFLDALGGAVLAAASVLIVAWVLGVAVSGARIPSVTSAVRGSEVLAKVDEVLPDSADRALQSFNDVVNTDLFPRFLDPFVPERIRETQPPDSAIARQQSVRDAYTRIAKVTGVASCSRGLEGSGFVYAPKRVMTNAHVVAGVSSPQVEVNGKKYDAKVVVFDPETDIAVLYVPKMTEAPLAFDLTGKADDPAVVLGYPENGPFDSEPARIRSEERLRGPDIYGDKTVTREAFSIWASVRPGNSGGPLLSAKGVVYGVVFAASVEDNRTGYVLTAQQVAADARAGANATQEVSTQSCT
ncbi:MarP family serine protease [Kribbella speibonae]|uniref:MarP family serine protease n=1 Tax=Kribbella speibonae TaxID=1572660 RepID=A0A4R0IEU0_9ACTN|nr:MarP family serine protease [Kribbella speibonae]TCC19592.1 MarP family serine protease [Kribbella speibonae]TCC31753.1 MarP family serine protease [Kribbella speibonae]